MIEVDTRISIPPARFPPVPFGIQRRMSAADRKLVLSALAEGPQMLPIDWPDLSPLLEELTRLTAAAEPAA